jgi:TonB-dependent receptor
MAHAQDDTAQTDENVDEIVATGIRQALKEARDLKRDADTAVDSITASDVSTLPDLSVAEALSRIPGVVAQQFDLSDNNGGDFPSPEGGNNLIRGLSFVRSEFNGREVFSANQGRALDFGTVPPELIGAVNVYKNNTADLIEGGIGGTIDLRTLEPFDRPDGFATITLDGTYTDFRDEISPEGTATVSHRWDGTRGEFGLLGSFAHSELKSRIDNYQLGQLIPVTSFLDNDNPPTDALAVPGGVQLRENNIDRERQSYYVAGQWRNNEDTFKATAKYFRIDNLQERDERTLEWFATGGTFFEGVTSVVGDFTSGDFTSEGLNICSNNVPGFARRDACQATLPASGLFESGRVTNNIRGWTGAQGAEWQTTAIDRDIDTTTQDISLNVEWRPADRWYVNLDWHNTKSETDFSQLWGVNIFFADLQFTPGNLDNPDISIIVPENSSPVRRLADGSQIGWGGEPFLPTDLSDPGSTFALAVADEFQINDGSANAFRADVHYEFDDDGWFDAIQFGARISEREQTNRQSGLNWAAVSPPWQGATGLPQGYLPLDQTNIPQEAVDFSGFFGGGIFTGTNSTVFFTGREFLENYDQAVQTVFTDPNIVSSVDGSTTSAWIPLRNANGQFRDGALPESSVGEDVVALYARADFGNEFDNGMSLEGNIGLRYTKAKISGAGTVAFVENFSEDAAAFNPESDAFLAQADQFIEGEFNEQEHWLPSFNAKLNLNDESLIRLAASKNITRPRIDQLNPGQSFNIPFSFIVEREIDPVTGEEVPGEGTIADVLPVQVSVFGGNPELQPIESYNFDLSFEHYFGDDNYFAVTGFYKDISKNIITDSITLGQQTLDDEVLNIILTSDQNVDEAEFLGVELAYQHFFDELPGIFSNLGIQANYTYIDASTNPLPLNFDSPNFITGVGDGVNDANIVDADGNGEADNSERIYRYGLSNFLGTSANTANIVGIYQDEQFEFRLAYNYRSEYLTSYTDFVTANPLFVKGRGQLDGSFKWDVTDALQLRMQVADIFGTNTVLEQQVDFSGQRYRRAEIKGDRRIKFGLRYNFW